MHFIYPLNITHDHLQSTPSMNALLGRLETSSGLMVGALNLGSPFLFHMDFFITG